MRYYKYELWINDAEDDWNENDLKYSEYFETIKDDLPQDFLKAYCDAHGFHDYEIHSMLLLDGNTLVLELVGDENQICVEYKNVSKLAFSSGADKLNRDMQISECLEWGYDEFFKEEDGIFTHCVLTSCGLEFSVSFTSVSVTHSKHNKPCGTVMYF